MAVFYGEFKLSYPFPTNTPRLFHVETTLMVLLWNIEANGQYPSCGVRDHRRIFFTILSKFKRIN